MPQNNTIKGLFSIQAGEDLSDKADIIVEMTHSSGTPTVQLPTANGNRPLYLLVEGAAAGAQCRVEPLSPKRNYRCRLKGAANPGDSLCLADIGTAGDKGKVRALPTTVDGTYRCFAVCEEAATDGGLALIRPNGAESVTITGN